MFLQAYGAALGIILAAVVLGRAICLICVGATRRFRASTGFAAAPAVGLAALIVIEAIAIKLPGRAVTADVVGLLVLALAVGFLLHREAFRFPWWGCALAGLTLLAAAVPFAASGRVGLPGVSLLNDTANHLLWAEGLRSARMAALWVPPFGYPLGPHSLVAAVGSLTGVPLNLVFTGLLVSVAPITALVAAGFLTGHPLWRRTVIGLLCAFSFLGAAYYGQGAFKETIMGALLLAFVIHLGELRVLWPEIPIAARWRQSLPALVLVLGALYTYSYFGVGWFAATLVLWALAGIVLHPRMTRGLLRSDKALRATPWVAATVALGLILAVPILGQASSFFGRYGVSAGSISTISAPLANLKGPLSPFEMFGIWTSADFRDTPHNLHTAAAVALAVAVLIFGVIWSLRRRDLLAPASVLACVLIWFYARRAQSPYVAAKALAIAAPLVLAVGLRGLLAQAPGRWWIVAGRLVAAALFCVLVGYASLRSLRDAPVQAPAPEQALEAFRPTVGASSVLFLGNDDYSPWLLRPAAVTNVAGIMARGPAALPRPNKPVATDSQAADFDSVQPADLNHFRYVVTSNSPYNSQPYANFRLVERNRFYALWQRTGATAPRNVIEPSGAPGGLLKCRTGAGRRLGSQHGVASIASTPPLTFRGWSGAAGSHGTIALRLPAGRWELSVQYFSDFGVDFSAPGLRVTMPAYVDRVGPFFALGTVNGRSVKAPVRLSVSAQHPSLFTSSFDNLFTTVPVVAATPIPDPHRLVPLKAACGRYVDWYRTT